MLDAVAGGEVRHRERPYWTAVCCHVVPPMRFATESCDALKAAVLAGMPILPVSAGKAGATAPAGLAGVLAQISAEVLAGLILCHTIDPNCRGIFAAWPFVSDLRTGGEVGLGRRTGAVVSRLRPDGQFLRSAKLGPSGHD